MLEPSWMQRCASRASDARCWHRRRRRRGGDM